MAGRSAGPGAGQPGYVSSLDGVLGLRGLSRVLVLKKRRAPSPRQRASLRRGGGGGKRCRRIPKRGGEKQG